MSERAYDIHPLQPFSLSVSCALAALSSISGKNWIELAADLERRGIAYEKGMHWADVETELVRLGYVADEVAGDWTTFGRWRKRHDVGDRSVYLITITSHAIVGQADMFVEATLLPLNERTWYDRRRVNRVFRVSPEIKGKLES